MRRFGIVGMFAFAVWVGISPLANAESETWVALDDAGISKALVGRTLEYANAWQDFRASGKTLYNAGSDSWGNWRVEADHYCSQWPPRDLWDCYKVEQSGDQIKFIGRHGDETIGTYRK